MTAFIYSATASADGYIAGPGGDMQWLRHFLDGPPDPLFEEAIAQVTALLIGRTTFDGDDPHAGDPDQKGAFEGRWEGPQIVLTHRPVESGADGFTITHTLEEAIGAARVAAGPEGVVHVVGADLARQCLEVGVPDEVLAQSPTGSACHYRVVK